MMASTERLRLNTGTSSPPHRSSVNSTNFLYTKSKKDVVGGKSKEDDVWEDVFAVPTLDMAAIFLESNAARKIQPEMKMARRWNS